ncbi:6-bladed beta-propeller [Algoriphagus boritolerans]|uniref:6-bladed beta-propeller protein n=1 Tax=Algoriphagus boritolerans DSM 17298 = JCM 18970 TaxID=1120964 RepID=A0A1H6AVE6_9BACT|nr:6-bladed beta-propeller [Algoriphagus boritolerans]SEG51766.1 hypothetical protein SAMN03080598_04310 [Algoriphagus boritolerans DSM 17298 = JCM 18970]
MKLLKISFVFFGIIVSGCSKINDSKENFSEVLVINPEEAVDFLSLSSIVDSIKYIKLENSENSFLGEVSEIIIKKNFIYVIDKSQQSIFLYNHEGSFMNKIDKLGDGPDQYRHLGPVFVDQNERFIEIIDYIGENSRILKYAIPTLLFLEERPLNAPIANSARRFNDVYYFAAQQIENYVNEKATNGDIIVVDEENKKSVLFDKKIDFKGDSFSPFVESFTQNEEGEIYVSLMYNDTFFKLSDKKAIPFLTLDFSGYEVDKELGSKSIQEQLKYLSNEANGKVSFPVLNAENSKILAFSYYFKENNKNRLYQYIKIKDSGKIFHTRVVNNDISSFPKQIYISSYLFGIKHEVIFQDYLVDIILPSFALEGKKEIETNSLGTIKIEDNPIIALMKIKK